MWYQEQAEAVCQLIVTRVETGSGNTRGHVTSGEQLIHCLLPSTLNGSSCIERKIKATRQARAKRALPITFLTTIVVSRITRVTPDENRFHRVFSLVSENLFPRNECFRRNNHQDRQTAANLNNHCHIGDHVPAYHTPEKCCLTTRRLEGSTKLNSKQNKSRHEEVMRSIGQSMHWIRNYTEAILKTPFQVLNHGSQVVGLKRDMVWGSRTIPTCLCIGNATHCVTAGSQGSQTYSL